MIRILTADDHPLLREGLAALIGNQTDMEIVAEAANGREAVELFRTHRPDITLMDLQMPEMSGIDAISSVRNEFPDARIIVLTTHAGDVQVTRALKAGARAYLLKGSLRKELLETIRAVHGGQKRLSSEVAAEIAEHATADTLTPRGNRSTTPSCGRERKQGDRGPVVAGRGDRQEQHQKHTRQTRRQRPYTCCRHRAEARVLRLVVAVGIPRTRGADAVQRGSQMADVSPYDCVGYTLQRLFSTFPNSWPGVGLVLLRLCLTVALLDVGAPGLADRSEATAVAQHSIAAVGGLFLFAGLWTPLVGTLVACDEVWITITVYSPHREEAWMHMFVATLALSLAMLGPGAWSIDARLFGRQRFDVGHRTRRRKPSL